uniref:DENN domain containing 1B n=1 Tax=Varanus komodoensis TaxID=61221 RepID=A0A8D2J5R4_VARKO
YLFSKQMGCFSFIEGRLARLNAGKGFSDMFEDEISAGGFSGGNSRSYHQWVCTVKKGGALINTAMNKASPAMKTAYRYVRSVPILFVLFPLDEYGPCSLGIVQYTPFSTLNNTARLNTEKRRLAQVRHQYNLISTAKIKLLSSEDSEETSYCLYDSDDSGEMAKTSFSPGEMDLLGEILDSLSTHSSDQGKLSGAKSLDFFRSMDDIDYKTTNKSNAPSVSNIALLCSSETSDPTSWNFGQDDSILCGKQLPPSPRKRVSYSSHRDSLFGLKKDSPTNASILDHVGFPKIPAQSPDSSEQTMQLCSPGPFHVKKTKWNETLSRTSEDKVPQRLSQNSSSLVPWERETRKGHEILEEGGLLHEVVSLCKMTSAFNHGLNISGDRLSSSSGHEA